MRPCLCSSAESRRTLDAHTKRLVAELDDRLQTSLASSDAESATLLLRAYSTVHQEAAAERLYNRKFVEPFMVRHCCVCPLPL